MLELSIQALHQAYRSGTHTPESVFTALRKQALPFLAGNTECSNPIWISLIDEVTLERYLQNLASFSVDSLPLYGVPFAIKDNIDWIELDTTAACPDFAYRPVQNATVVDLLIKAGAIPLGKTNMDQFATGLVGTRSPYGACKNAFNSEWISGGSSSGSAVAVAEGLVSFSLGTDTAGSGRVPAALNKLIGLKPSRGLVSTFGVVPACRTLDCVSIFAKNTFDANTVFDVVAKTDEADPYSRRNKYENGPRYFGSVNPSDLVLGVPQDDQLFFANNDETADSFQETVNAFRSAGAKIKILDFTPFLKAAKLLYEGPWVAERYLATQPLIETAPHLINPTVRSIIEKGNQASALDTFSAQYQLQACKAAADSVLSGLDAVLTPTIPSPYTIEQVEQDPIALNSQLGYYTNFMNLLDYAAVAVPTATLQSSVGFGVTLFHKALSDKSLLGIAQTLEGLLTRSVPNVQEKAPASDQVVVAVCGAHMTDLPLNWQLRERDAAFVCATSTSANYQLFALPGGPVARPGLLRDEGAGKEISVELWRMPIEHFGSFVAEIPAPLGVGKLELRDGRLVTGFICEPYALNGAENITSFGGWRAYLNQL